MTCARPLVSCFMDALALRANMAVDAVVLTAGFHR